MNKIILLLIAATIGLAAQADYTITTQQPLSVNPNYLPVDYAASQPYSQMYPQPYGQGYAQTSASQYPQPYNQAYYSNPYLTQCQGQYANPYAYRNPYSTSSPYSVVNSALSGLGTTTGTGVAKTIGRSMLFSLLRGY